GGGRRRPHPDLPAARLRGRRGRPLPAADVGDGRVPRPDRPLPVGGGPAHRPRLRRSGRLEERRLDGARARRRARRGADQGRDRQRRGRPRQVGPARRPGGGRPRAAPPLHRHRPGPAGGVHAAVPPHHRRGRAVAADRGRRRGRRRPRQRDAGRGPRAHGRRRRRRGRPDGAAPGEHPGVQETEVTSLDEDAVGPDSARPGAVDPEERVPAPREGGGVTLSVVILTMGNRPAELARAVRSALDQENVAVEVILVGNGVPGDWTPGDDPAFEDERVTLLRLPKNVGIPAGRNGGVEASSGDVILFLDDDGWYRSTRLGTYLRDRFAAEPDLGVVSFRVRDPEGGRGERRHVPRLRAGDPERSSAVTTFLGGACAVRRAAFDAGGGLPEDFFYAHEETDLAWRVLDAGYRIVYD